MGSPKRAAKRRRALAADQSSTSKRAARDSSVQDPAKLITDDEYQLIFGELMDSAEANGSIVSTTSKGSLATAEDVLACGTMVLEIEESSNGMAGWQLREGLKNSMEKIRKKHQKNVAKMAASLVSRRTTILNNIRVRKEKIARDKVNQLNHFRFKRAREEYVWDEAVAATDKRILNLEAAAMDIIDADPAKVELWYLTPYSSMSEMTDGAPCWDKDCDFKAHSVGEFRLHYDEHVKSDKSFVGKCSGELYKTLYKCAEGTDIISSEGLLKAKNRSLWAKMTTHFRENHHKRFRCDACGKQKVRLGHKESCKSGRCVSKMEFGVIANRLPLKDLPACEHCSDLREASGDENLLCIAELTNVKRAMEMNYLEFLAGTLEKKPPFSPSTLRTACVDYIQQFFRLYEQDFPECVKELIAKTFREA